MSNERRIAYFLGLSALIAVHYFQWFEGKVPPGSDAAHLCRAIWLSGIFLAIVSLMFAMVSWGSEWGQGLFLRLETWLIRRRKDTRHPEDIWMICVHEAGHTLAAVLLCGIDYMDRVTIERTEKTSGTFKPTRSERRNYFHEAQVRKEIMISLASDVAMKLCLEHGYIGCSKDLDDARRDAMCLIGTIGDEKSPGLFATFGSNWNATSEAGRHRIESRISAVITECYIATTALLAPKKDQLLAVAKELQDRRTLARTDIARILKM